MTTNKPEVKRYDYGYTDDGHGGGRYLGLIPKHDGKLVRYEAYEALHAKCDTLVTALEAIAESCDVGRHDGLPEEGPALCATESWLIAKDALAAHHKGGDV